MSLSFFFTIVLILEISFHLIKLKYRFILMCCSNKLNRFTTRTTCSGYLLYKIGLKSVCRKRVSDCICFWKILFQGIFFILVFGIVCLVYKFIWIILVVVQLFFTVFVTNLLEPVSYNMPYRKYS